MRRWIMYRFQDFLLSGLDAVHLHFDLEQDLAFTFRFQRNILSTKILDQLSASEDKHNQIMVISQWTKQTRESHLDARMVLAFVSFMM